MDIEELISTIIECAYNVRLQLGPGFWSLSIKMH